MAEINPRYPITELTQEQYDALDVKDAHTLYAIPFDGVPPSRQRPDSGNTLPCLLITQADYDALGAYDVNTLYCIGQPEPVYDETKIAVVLLDANLDRTNTVTYYDTIAEVNQALPADANTRYDVIIGAQTCITSIPASAFIRGGTPIKSLTRLFIPSGVTSIGQSACNGCAGLIYADFPDTLTTIGDSAFNGCGLQTIDVPGSVSVLPNYGFTMCPLTRVTISSGVTSIGSNCFMDCAQLPEITIPGTVTDIGYFVFTRCYNLQTITINKQSGSISGAPWGATNANIIWTG